MKKLYIFFVGAVLGSLTETQIRRKLYDYQTLTGVDDAVISDLLRLVSRLFFEQIFLTSGGNFSFKAKMSARNHITAKL